MAFGGSKKRRARNADAKRLSEGGDPSNPPSSTHNNNNNNNNNNTTSPHATNKKKTRSEGSNNKNHINSKKGGGSITKDANGFLVIGEKGLKNDKLTSFYMAQRTFGYYGRDATATATESESESTTSQVSIEEAEKDLKLFHEYIKKPLNASFRLSRYAPLHFKTIFKSQVEEMIAKPMSITVLNESTGKDSIQKIEPARCIKFLEGAYQLDVDRKTIRRNPQLSEFHEWLKVQTNVGHITRQETVSMIPPACLNIEPHHSVLDMCAAPGSKTTQMLEIVSQYDSAIKGEHPEPKGFVVANDSDTKRAYMLVHQVKRINSPAILITTHRGQDFPMPKVHRNYGLGAEGCFDRVLCDVPCTGDGTIRKNIQVWQRWTASASISIHQIQLQIALKGAVLCKVGGLICYSTCSMCPYENEAVVCEIMRRCKGGLEIVDGRLLVEKGGLEARGGMVDWKVLDDKRGTAEHFNRVDGVDGKPSASEDNAMLADGEEVEEEEEVSKEIKWSDDYMLKQCKKNGLHHYPTHASVPQKMKQVVAKSLWPPTPAEAAAFGLEKCLRVCPQDMDTGGFFVCVFKKVKPIGEIVGVKAAEKKAAAAALAAAGGGCGGESVVDDDDDDDDNDNEDGLMEGLGGDDEDEDVVCEDGTTLKAGRNKNNANNANGKKKADDADKTEEDGGGDEKEKGAGKDWEGSGNQEFIAMPQTFFDNLTEHYGLAANTPTGQFLARGAAGKSVQFVTKAIKNLIDSDTQKKLKVVHSGLLAFQRNSKNSASDSEYRLCQEGVQLIVPYVDKRVAVCNRSDFSILCNGGTVDLRHLSDALQQRLAVLAAGCFVVVLEEAKDRLMDKLCMCFWKNKAFSINCLVDKVGLEGMVSKVKGSGYWVDVKLPVLPNLDQEEKRAAGKDLQGAIDRMDETK